MTTRVVVYELKNGQKEVFNIGNLPENEQHERVSAQREIQNPNSAVMNFQFEWRDTVPKQHSWYE